MICTSSYSGWKSNEYVAYSISGDSGRSANYNGRCYLKLAPKMSFWRIWHNNIGKVHEEENNKYYVREYWNQVLSKLDPEEVYRELDNSVLLCYEPNTDFCHRHIVAAWFELLLGVKVPELVANDCRIVETAKPINIKEYLEETMKLNIDMCGFESLRALYLFQKSEKMETIADELEEKNVKCSAYYRQMASSLRWDADMAEYEYKKIRRDRQINKKRNVCD